MSIDSIKKTLSQNVGVLNGLQKKVESPEVQEIENIEEKKENIEITTEEIVKEIIEDEHMEEVKAGIDDKIANILNKKTKKRKLQLATYNLWDDQIEDIAKLAKKSDMKQNEFLREALGVLIEQFKEALK